MKLIKKKLQGKLNKFIKISKSIVKTHPELVVICFHEYFRSLYKFDPYIYKRHHSDPVKNILVVLDNCINFLNTGKKFGSYLTGGKKIKKSTKIETGKLFGTLWTDRLNNNYLNSLPTLKKFFKRSKFYSKNLKGKFILDMGCGSGRFTAALASLGARQAIGVDQGLDGLKIAKRYALEKKIKNVKYKKASVLNLPFKNERFDFVFCKGVLHHTGNLKKGLNEFYRVMKKGGGGFLYLYGSGGLFWNSRKKMRTVMKKIPYEKAFNILKLIEMPARRTIFLDSWYVEIEDHVDKIFLENWFKKKKLEFIKYKNPIKTELEYMNNYQYFKEMYGSGELRYFIKK